MESNAAIASLSALAHPVRLDTFRLLVQAGETGLAAGEIARRLGILPNSLSTSLSILNHAGLITARRDGRSIIYSAAYGRMREVVAFLLEDCCSGRPEICAPVAQSLERLACCP